MPKVNTYEKRKVDATVKKIRKAFDAARYEHGITQNMVEVEAGIPSTTLSHILRGTRPITIMENAESVLQAIERLSKEFEANPL